MKNKKNPQLDKEEKEIIDAIERGEFSSTKNLANDRKKYAEMARNTIDRKKSISIRLSERDLARLKQKAAEEGMPYQTLISSTLHKFVNGEK